MSLSSASFNSHSSDGAETRKRLYEIAYTLAVPANLLWHYVMSIHMGFTEPWEIRLIAVLAALTALFISRTKRLSSKATERAFAIVLSVHAVHSTITNYINDFQPTYILGSLLLLCCGITFMTTRIKLISFAALFGGAITIGSIVQTGNYLPGVYFLIASSLMIPAMIVHQSIYERLAQKTERLNDIFNNTASGIVQLDGSGKILQTNQRLEDLVEYKEREIQSLLLSQICHENDRERVEAFLFNARGESNPQVEARLQTRAGKYIWVRLVASTQPPKQQSDEIILLVLDIMQEKKLNELSAFQKQILTMFAKKTAFNQIVASIAKFVSVQTGGLPVVISLLRSGRFHIAGNFNLPENVLESLNYRLLTSGYGNASEAVRKKALTIAENISDSPLWQEYLKGMPLTPLKACWTMPIISEAGDPAGVIEVFKYTEGSPNQTVLQTLDICSTLTGMAVMVNNSEELQKTYLANFTQTAKLASLGEMAAGIAHEINNPMTIIQGRAEQIIAAAKEPTPNVEKINSVAENILKNVQRVAKIIRGLRAFARFNHDTDLAPLNLKNMITETVDLCGERFKVQNVSLSVVSIDGNLWIKSRGPQVSQVLLNLLNNAFDAVATRSGERWIEIKAIETVEFIQLTVTDAGNGIAHEVMDRLFEPFFTTKGVDKGTGLGLSISHGIVSDHGGRIYVDQSCKNTRFVLELPKATPPAISLIA